MSEADVGRRRDGMGGHHSPAMETDVWLTPLHILDALGPFDLDPCACMEPRPWPTAARHYTRLENGLLQPWVGRVWLNPPYGAPSVVAPWMRRMAEHGDGIALIFARTETEVFFETVWGRADAVMFLRGRLFFHYPDGRKASNNSGAPSALIAYGARNVSALVESGLDGHFVLIQRVFMVEEE